MLLDDMEVSTRIKNSIMFDPIDGPRFPDHPDPELSLTVDDVKHLTDKELLSFHGFGTISLKEWRTALSRIAA